LWVYSLFKPKPAWGLEKVMRELTGPKELEGEALRVKVFSAAFCLNPLETTKSLRYIETSLRKF
jgi:hypothetical protein